MSALTPTWLQEEIVRVLNWGNQTQSLGYLEKALYSSQASLCKEIITVLGRSRFFRKLFSSNSNFN